LRRVCGKNVQAAQAVVVQIFFVELMVTLTVLDRLKAYNIRRLLDVQVRAALAAFDHF
jgi:hypothetical protein